MNIRLFAAFVAILAGAACDVRVGDKGVSLDVSEGGRAEDQSTQTFPLATGGQIELDTRFANIQLTRATGSAVEVTFKRYANARTDEAAQALLKQEHVTVETAPDRLTIRGTQTEGQDFRRRIRIDYAVRVPAGAGVTIKNDFGSVSLENVDARITVRSTNSRIEGDKVSGGLDIETVNGGVEIDMAAVTSDVRIRTVNGGITMGLPRDLNATLEARAINGGVNVNDTLPLQALRRDRSALSARLGTGMGPRMEFDTTNGGVNLRGGAAPR